MVKCGFGFQRNRYRNRLFSAADEVPVPDQVCKTCESIGLDSVSGAFSFCQLPYYSISIRISISRS